MAAGAAEVVRFPLPLLRDRVLVRPGHHVRLDDDVVQARLQRLPIHAAAERARAFAKVVRRRARGERKRAEKGEPHHSGFERRAAFSTCMNRGARLITWSTAAASPRARSKERSRSRWSLATK